MEGKFIWLRKDRNIPFCNSRSFTALFFCFSGLTPQSAKETDLSLRARPVQTAIATDLSASTIACTSTVYRPVLLAPRCAPAFRRSSDAPPNPFCRPLWPFTCPWAPGELPRRVLADWGSLGCCDWFHHCGGAGHRPWPQRSAVVSVSAREGPLPLFLVSFVPHRASSRFGTGSTAP